MLICKGGNKDIYRTNNFCRSLLQTAYIFKHIIINGHPLSWFYSVCAYILFHNAAQYFNSWCVLVLFLCRKNENMSPCTGSRVNTSYERIVSSTGT